MNTKLKEIVTIFPLLTLVIYSLGFVIITGYLNQFGLPNDELFNTSFIKTGLLLSILIAPILIVLYLNFEKPTDNLLEAKKYFPMLLVNTLSYLVFISIFLIDFRNIAVWETMITVFAIFLDVNLYLLATSLLFKHKKSSTKIIMQLTIPIIFLAYYSYRFPFLFTLYSMIMVTCQYFVIILGVVADKKYNWGHFSVYIIWFISISFFFGRIVYPKVPNHLGGGAPIRTTILAKPENLHFLKLARFTCSDSVAFSIDLLYVSSDKYLMRINDKTYFLSKDLFYGFIPEK